MSPRCGTAISILWPERSREDVGEKLAVGEIDGHVDVARDVSLIEVELLEQRGEEGRGGEVRGGLDCGLSSELGSVRPRVPASAQLAETTSD